MWIVKRTVWVCFVFHMKTMPDVTYSLGRCVATVKWPLIFLCHDILSLCLSISRSLSCSFYFARSIHICSLQLDWALGIQLHQFTQKIMFLPAKLHTVTSLNQFFFGSFLLLSLHWKFPPDTHEIVVKFSAVHRNGNTFEFTEIKPFNWI